MDPLIPDNNQQDKKTSLPERIFLALAMLGIISLCMTVTITVLSRTVYKSIIPDDVLIVREIMVATILFPLAAVTATRSHIAVTIFTNWVSYKSKILLFILAHVIGIVFSSCLLFAGLRLFWGAWQSGEYYDGDLYIPMWTGYATFLLALIIFLARLIVIFVSDIKLFSKKNGV